MSIFIAAVTQAFTKSAPPLTNPTKDRAVGRNLSQAALLWLYDRVEPVDKGFQHHVVGGLAEGGVFVH